MLLARCAGTRLWSRGQRTASPSGSGTHTAPSPSACWVPGCWGSSLGLCTPRQVFYRWSVPLKPATTVLTKIVGDPPHGCDKYLTHRWRKEEFIFVSQFQGTVHLAGKAWWFLVTERERVPGSIFASYSVGDRSPWVPPTFGVHLSTSVNPVWKLLPGLPRDVSPQWS